MTTKITQEHVRIAAMCAREGWDDISAEFVAESERLTGIPFLKMTVEDMERAVRLKRYEMLAADAAAEAELRLIGQALVANGQLTQAEYNGPAIRNRQLAMCRAAVSVWPAPHFLVQ